jgi:hypothetical protein
MKVSLCNIQRIGTDCPFYLFPVRRLPRELNRVGSLHPPESRFRFYIFRFILVHRKVSKCYKFTENADDKVFLLRNTSKYTPCNIRMHKF